MYSHSVSKRISKINCQFDIVQSSEFGSEAFWFAFKKNAPLITRLATPFFLTEALNGKAFFGPRPFFNWMERQQTLRSDGIFTSTRALAQIVTEKWRIQPSAVEIIPNSIDLSRVVHLGKNNPAPDILRNKVFLLYFGRLEERKGIRVLAKALPAVLSRYPNLSMVFVGSDLGYRGSSLKGYILEESGKYANRIIFFDNLSQEKLFPIVHSAKIVILPSLWEAFGFVCVEAMALGRPVIATSGSGFEEIIEDNVSGYLVEPGKSDLLASKIIGCLGNENDLHRVSAGALRRARDFDAGKIAIKLISFYKRTSEEWMSKGKRR